MTTRVLYISYDGMGEPLGQSQVLTYLEQLATKHEVYLLSFEKNLPESESVRSRIERANIRWYPLAYHKSPSGPATAYDISAGIVRAAAIVRRERIQVVHARSYVPSVIALAMKKLGARFLFDMRGFWADERVDGGLWPANGRMFHVAKWFENRFMENADHVVSLTHTAVDEMRSWRSVPPGLPISVIPTCADLDRFQPSREKKRNSSSFVMGYVGSVGTWYLFDEVAKTFAALKRLRPNAHLRVLNRGDQALIRSSLRDAGVSGEDFSLASVPHAEVAKEVQQMDVGVFYIRSCFSKKASAPTKMAEFLGCGVPCIANSGVGDIERIFLEDQVGVTLDHFSRDAHNSGVSDLLELASSAETRNRCRRSAEKRISVKMGVAAYDGIYQSLTSV